MSSWFIRSNGETAHNEPGTSLHMDGEPPAFPARKFNYRKECLDKGFARVGWPGTGDLREPTWRSQARQTYGSMMKRHHVRYLQQFVHILPGDLVLLPTDGRCYQVHLGVVVPPRRPELARAGIPAYYYYFDIPGRNWYENAHRVDVDWAKGADGAHGEFNIPGIGGTWRRGFGQVTAGEPLVIQMATAAGLLR